jgi:steroid 5-alpha reductase family enzyme
MDQRKDRQAERKLAGVIICLIAYGTAGLLSWLIHDVIALLHPILLVLILDILATLTIFLFSVMFNNSSIYDPYWSVAPPVIMIFWVYGEQTTEATTLLQLLIMGLTVAWSLRLTINWLRRWRGIRDEDWRYISFRFKYQEQYWIVSLFGIHLFPSLIVFLGCLSVYPALVLHKGNMGVMEWIAAGVTFSGILIETIADQQLRSYNRNKAKCDFQSEGLWKYSRHPNYFGEVLFWVGLFLFSTGMEQAYWWILPGPVFMILLFYFISIPLIDKRMLRRRTGYRNYLKRTSALIPLPPGKPQDSAATLINSSSNHRSGMLTRE